MEYILAKPVTHDPGSYWYYSGGSVNLLGELVERATGTTIDEFARTELFEPLGITDVRWSEVNTDMVDASGKLELRPRDLAKFGQLYLDDGVWNGVEVIPNEWIDTSIAEQIAIPGRSVDGHGYGYKWFIQTFEHDGEHLDAAVRTGWGGQALAVFPSLDTLVVVTGGDYVQQSFVSELIGSHVVPAIAG